MKNKNKSMKKAIFSTMLQDFVMCLKVIVFIALCISIVTGLCCILYWLIVHKLYWIIAIVVIIIAFSEWYHSAKERVLSKKMEEEK
jgi:hypothetical protein